MCERPSPHHPTAPCSGHLMISSDHRATDVAVDQPKGRILFEDASEAYQEKLTALVIDVSMSRRGNCLDNAVVESFFETLKQELVHHARWHDKANRKGASIACEQ